MVSVVRNAARSVFWPLSGISSNDMVLRPCLGPEVATTRDRKEVTELKQFSYLERRIS